MAITKTTDGWHVDIQPGGRGGKRYRKTLPTKAEALAYEAFVRSKVVKAPDWKPAKRDMRRLSELVQTWYDNHGKQLRAGEDTFARLNALCVALGDPMADQFKTTMFTEYRTKRLSLGISASCLNREHAYLRAVFNELRRIGEWSGSNPMAEVRQFKIEEKELAYLTVEQIRELLSALALGESKDTAIVAKICLATGARWSEAEELKGRQVRQGMLHYSKTKSGKNRSVPLDEDLYQELEARIEKTGSGRLFVSCYEDFRRGVDRAGLELPKGQLTHVLRHTFASHFMMNGGNILVLQRILGHSNLTMTMRYAHFAPEHLIEARKLNPLSLMNGKVFRD